MLQNGIIPKMMPLIKELCVTLIYETYGFHLTDEKTSKKIPVDTIEGVR